MRLVLQQFLRFSLVIFLGLFSYFQYCFANKITNKQTLFEKIEFINGKNSKKTNLFFNDNPEFKIFTLQNPSRLVLDFKNTALLQPNYQPVLPNFISAFRFRTQQNELRLVFDLQEEFILQNIATDHQKNLISFDLANYNSVQSENNSKSLKTMQTANEENNLIIKKTADSITKYTIRDNKKKPTIVLDAGHGGKDPGTIGVYAGTHEKNITLAYAKELAKQLKKENKYKIFLTREDDRFLPLKTRVEFARKKKADLFISLHANAISDSNVSGFSIYTLSEKSSDKQAEILAQKENQADIIYGVDFADASKDVIKTLIDLSQRQAKNYSTKFALETVLAIKQTEIKILQNSHRFAGFMVLTAPDVASVLIELGYLSNKQEEEMLNSVLYRRKIAHSLVVAINKYFTL
jgi:N-acetylmuramoyl-L-alanine amidase